MFLVISVYFNIRNTLPKSGTFLLGHAVCVCVCLYIYISVLLNELFLLFLINLTFGLMAITVHARHVKFYVHLDHLHT